MLEIRGGLCVSGARAILKLRRSLSSAIEHKGYNRAIMSSPNDGFSRDELHGLPREVILKTKLSKGEFRRVADARRTIWTAGFAGMVCGCCFGYLGGLLYVKKNNLLSMKRRSALITSVLLGGSLTSFVGSVLVAQGAIGDLGDMWGDRAAAQTGYGQKRQSDLASTAKGPVAQPSAAGTAANVAAGTPTVAGEQAEASPGAHEAAGEVKYDRDPYAGSKAQR